MRAAAVVAALVLALPAAALAQARPLLVNPADANRDGVVSEDERADYLARKAAGIQDAPGLPVSAPKAGGESRFLLGQGTPGSALGAMPDLDARAVAPSGFEEALDARDRETRNKDD